MTPPRAAGINRSQSIVNISSPDTSLPSGISETFLYFPMISLMLKPLSLVFPPLTSAKPTTFMPAS